MVRRYKDQKIDWNIRKKLRNTKAEKNTLTIACDRKKIAKDEMARGAGLDTERGQLTAFSQDF